MMAKLLLSLLLAVVLIQASEMKNSLFPLAEGFHQEPTSFDFESSHSRILNTPSPTVINCAPGHSTKSDGSSCDSCGTWCAYCDDFTQTCLGCVDSYRMEINPSDKTKCRCKGTQTSSTTTCQCGQNQWFDGNTCQTVASSCATTEYLNAGTCLNCATVKKIKAKSLITAKIDPSCCAGQKYLNINGLCQQCAENCASCSDTTGNCLKCAEKIKAHISLNVKKTSCCQNSEYMNTSLNPPACQTCPDGNCQDCQDITGTCIHCSNKITSKPAKAGVKKLPSCCGDKQYYSTTTHNCQPCTDSSCSLCEDISGKCLACSNQIVAKKSKLNIKKLPSCCGDKQYYQAGSTPNCKSCSDNCEACKDGDGACIRCSESIKASKVKIKIKKTSCCVDDNKYWSSNNQCDTCPGNQCLMCKDGSGDCINCDKIVKGQALNISVKVCCNPGKYYSTTTHNCQPCPDANCNKCENLSGKCLECQNKIKALGGKANIKKQPSCCSSASQYYDNTQHKCLNCVANCKLCEDVSGNCLKCSESYKFKTSASAKKTSCCPSMKFWDDTNKKCEACDLSCKDCEDVTGNCICNKSIPIKGKAGIKPTSCCDSGKYWDTSCKACQVNCSECKDGSGDCLKCNGKTSFVATAYSKTGKCCSDGFYYENGKCNACKKPCATCSSATQCDSCTENATFDKTTNSCICKSGTYNGLNDCVGCNAPCKTCTSDTICSSCRAHATFDSFTKLCSCNSGFTLNSTSTAGYCVATCNSICTECSADDGSKCSKCVTNAELSGTKCSCTANSSFDESSKTCVCNTGYTLAYNKCIGCKKYLSPTDIKAANFSSTWTSINIYFGAKLDTTLDPTCSKVFNSSTLSLLGTEPICSWLDQKTLKVVLGSLFTLRNQTMYLDGTYLVKDTSEACSLTYQPLPVIPKTSTSPAPTASLSGPSSASLSCGGSDPLKYSGEKSTMSIGSMSCSWSSTISPTNSQLSEYIKNQKSSSISVPRGYFDISVTTTLNLTLQVTNYFGLKSTTWLVTTVTGESSLSVIFDQGSSVSMKASSSSTIKAKISSLCDNSASSTFSWSWKYYSGPKIDSDSILQSAFNDKLTIKKNALTATTDTPYVFQAIATQSYNGATITGNSTIAITVTSSPLSIQLSKTSGDVSPDSDYNINANSSKDPDDSNGSLAYSWTCLNSADSTACIGNDGKTLLYNETSANLKIPSSRLVKGAQWDITCTIFKDIRTASATVTLNILNTIATSSAEIQLKAEKFNPQGVNQFSASVTSNYNPTLLWSVTSGQTITISPNYLSTISLPSGTLSEGSSYTFTLSISAQGKTFKVHLPVYSNLGAACAGSATADPTTGNALTTSFKLSVDGCYDKDEEDYPLTFRYLDITGGKTYTLGYTTEINYLLTYLFPNENDITIKVCDSMVTCSDYPIILNISPTNSRRLSSSSLMEAYLESTIDNDNVPATISLFCGSATIDSDLFSKMWTDLQSYVTNNEVTNDSLQNALGATYLMTTQTKRMSAQMFTTMAAWLSGIIANNPSIIPSQENMITVVALVNNYLSYGHLTSYSEMTLEDYILNADKFLTYWEIAATLDDLVTQSAMDGSQNTDITKVFKYRDFPTSLVNRTVKISANQTISTPSKLSYTDTDIMNIKLHYYNISGEDSDITMISFANSGTYVNYELKTSTETYVPFATSDYPFEFELPINIGLGKHYAWTCLFYNETNKTWVEDGCEITDIKNNSIVFETYHFSMFKLSQTEIVVPTGPSDGSCGDNFVPLYILVVTLLIFVVFAPILSVIDRKQKNRKINPVPVLEEVDCHRYSFDQFMKNFNADTFMKNDDNAKNANNPADSLEVESVDGENEPVSKLPNANVVVSKDKEPETPKTPNDIKRAPTKIVLAKINSSDIDLSKSLPDGEFTKAKPDETELQLLLEGSVLFGLIYYRHNFPRSTRLFILITVVIFELLLEGLLIYGFENTSKGGEMSIENLFSDYEPVYFGYTVLAVVIAVPIEIFMISASTIDKSRKLIWPISAVILGAVVIIGSIIEIVLLNIEFCFEWSGYWVISFLYGILVQVFVVETVYMIKRYLTAQFSS